MNSVEVGSTFELIFMNTLKLFIKDHVVDKVERNGIIGYSLDLFDVKDNHLDKKIIDESLKKFDCIRLGLNYRTYWTDDLDLVVSFLLENADLLMALMPLWRVIGFFMELMGKDVPWKKLNGAVSEKEYRRKW